MRLFCRQRGCVSEAKAIPADGLCPTCRDPLIGDPLAQPELEPSASAGDVNPATDTSAAKRKRRSRRKVVQL